MWLINLDDSNPQAIPSSCSVAIAMWKRRDHLETHPCSGKKLEVTTNKKI
jgi:hypothetical protein